MFTEYILFIYTERSKLQITVERMNEGAEHWLICYKLQAVCATLLQMSISNQNNIVNFQGTSRQSRLVTLVPVSL